MLDFLIQYIKNPRTIGAVAPSSKYLSSEMIKNVDFNNARLIVEYGAGTGSFSEEIIKRKKSETVLILIEQNIEFCKILNEKFHNSPNVKIVHGSAENVVSIIKKSGFEKADYIISGLPFTSLPEKISENIFTATQKVIGKKGKFITFQYSMIKCNFFSRYFRISAVEYVKKNIPPAYVLTFQN